MANTLYSAYMAAGSSSGKYKASLYETSNWADKFDFIGKQTAWEEEKTSRRVSAIGDTLELASTAYGGYQDKEKTLSQAKSLEGKYGSLQEDRRSHGERGFDWLMGKEQTYTFGEGESATTLSKEAVKVQGAIAMGESMLAEYQDKFYGKDTKKEIKKEIKKEMPTLSLERKSVLFGDSLAKGLSNIKSDDNTDSSFSNSENIDSFSPYGINSREELF